MASGYTSPPPVPHPEVSAPPVHPEPPPHPYLHEPILYISNLAPHVLDSDVARAFEACIPFRPNILRDGSGRPLSGTIEFKELEKAEKALTIVHARPIPSMQPTAHIYLSPFPPSNPPYVPAAPQAQPRLVKHLPPHFSDSSLYDLFRPYGAMASVHANHAGFAEGTGVVEFYLEEDARNAEAALHCAEVGDANIAVQVYQQRRTSGTASEFGVNPNATSFVPGGGALTYPAQQYSPPRSQYGYVSLRQSPSFVHGPGQQVQFAPMHGPGSTSHSGLIDPCNLFCKNLDPDIDSNGLFTHFRRFGQIVSARVMRNDNGQSRGFGFVSFQTPDQAASAMQAMNGVILGSKQLVVRLHEPKQLRQEKLAHRFGSSGAGSGHIRTRSGSGATSPTLSEGGDSYWGRSSPGGPVSPGGHGERVRRSSGSYYTAALAGNLNLPMRYEELSALSPVVRREVLTGELSRRIKDVPGITVPDNEVDSVVETLLGLSLHQVVDGIQDSSKLAEQVQNAKDLLAASAAEAPGSNNSPSPAASHDSRLLDPNALNATASAPEHPSTPLSLSASLSTPPRTSSPSGSIAQGSSEKERLMAAVFKLEPKNAAEITELLMSLTKRERALCLFNPGVLKKKVTEANDILEAQAVAAEREDAAALADQISRAHASASGALATPLPKPPREASGVSPQTPDLSSRGPSTVASPASPHTPAQGTTVHTLASLSRLPASEIIKLANSSSSTGLPLAKADPRVLEATDEFIDGLQGKPTQQQKQLLGEKLFKVIKTFGVKNAPKITIALLDQEDIRSLAHLMNSYPSVLREKALQSPLASGSK